MCAEHILVLGREQGHCGMKRRQNSFQTHPKGVLLSIQEDPEEDFVYMMSCKYGSLEIHGCTV